MNKKELDQQEKQNLRAFLEKDKFGEYNFLGPKQKKVVQKDLNLVPTTTAIKKVKGILSTIYEFKAKYDADIEHLECWLANKQEFKCIICERYIHWIKGRQPKYCKRCKLAVKKVRAKVYAEKNPEKVRQAAKNAMRKRRKLYFPQDD